MGSINTVLGHVLGPAWRCWRRTPCGPARACRPDLGAAAAPYLECIATAGRYPHFTRWAADPARNDRPPQSFERILGWLLDGLATLRV